MLIEANSTGNCVFVLVPKLQDATLKSSGTESPDDKPVFIFFGSEKKFFINFLFLTFGVNVTTS